MPMISRTVSVLAVLTAAFAVTAPVSSADPSGPLTQPGCADVATVVSEFKSGGPPPADWRENLEFDGHGTLWVSHSAGQVEGYTSDGTLRARFPVPSPGGIRRGIDGLMYVNYGIGPLPGGDGGIMRFDPAASAPRPEVFVSGVSGHNGLAIDELGNFYLGRELAPSILKITPAGARDEAWTAAADVFGTNGVTVAGGELYASALSDLRSPVQRLPLDDPAAHSTVAALSPSPLEFKGLDDLEAVHDSLYVTAFLRGELVRVNRSTGATCVLVPGLTMPTSVRVPVGFAGADPGTDVFVTEASGRILKVTITPRG